MNYNSEEVIKLTQQMIESSENNTEYINKINDIQSQLPSVEDGQFLITVKQNNNIAVFCARELSWFEAQEIELKAFRANGKDSNYFSGEFEKREILKKAIIWVCQIEPEAKYFLNDSSGNIVKIIQDDIINDLWGKYQSYTTLGSSEAAFLYSAAQSYFEGKAQSGHPVPPIVIEVDFWLKGVQWTKEEFRSISASDLERIQLILTARSDVLGITSPNNQTNKERSQGIEESFMATLPQNIWGKNKKQ